MNTVNVTEDQLYDDLRTALVAVLPAAVDVFRTQVNRVPQDLGPSYVMLTPLNQQRLSVGASSYDRINNLENRQSSQQFNLQIDVYGPDAQINAIIICELLRSEQGCNLMQILQPLLG